jgi:S-adenosylmethionine:tRNA-ribosyltransferase-isomerase (queuine synthetase)
MSELDKYDYDLPKQLIAQQPVSSRVDAGLLVVDRA